MKKIILATIVALSLSAGANASVLNPSEFFNDQIDAGVTVQSDTNLWQLGYLSAGEFTLLDFKSDIYTSEEPLNYFSSFDFYKNSIYYGFGINRTDADVSVFNGVVAEDAIYAHPGDLDGGDVVLRFNAQAAANYTFDTSFNIVHYGQASLDVSLNNASGTTNLLSTSYTLSSPTSYQGTLYLAANDSVDFTIERYDGTWAGDSTAIVANVTSTAVPLPASLGLMLLGFGALGFRKRKA